MKPFYFLMFLIFLILFLAIALFKIYEKFTQEVRPSKPTFENFLKFRDLIICVYGYYYTINDKGEFVLDKNGETIEHTSNIDLKKNQQNLPAIQRVTNVIKSIFGFTDITPLYGFQDNIISYSSHIYGIIAKTKDGNGVLIFRGTCSPRDFITDLKGGLMQINKIPEFSSLPDWQKAHNGFLKLYGLENPLGICMSKQIKDWITARPEVKNYSISGHSLGGALATLASYQIKFMLKKNIYEVYLYSSPRVFQRASANNYNSLMLNTTYNFYNNLDIVHVLPTSLVEWDKSFIGLDIIPGNSGCFQHIGLLMGIDFVSPLWKHDDKLLMKWHSIQSLESLENIQSLSETEVLKQFKRQIFDQYINNPPNPPNNRPPNDYLSKPSYSKFIEYSTILKSIYSLNNFLSYKFRPQNTLPDVINVSIKTFQDTYKITNLQVICISDINSLLFKDYVIPVGIIGTYKNKGVIVFGNDYNNFPVNLNFNGFLPSVMKYDILPEIKNNILFKNSKIAKEFNDLFYKNCLNNKWCPHEIINNWISNNPSVKDFVIIGQCVGSVFGVLSALEIRKNNKNVFECYLYGSPRLGDPPFARAYNSILGNQTYSFLNLQDPNTQLLPYISSLAGEDKDNKYNVYQHVGKLYIIDKPSVDTPCDFNKFLKDVRSPKGYLNVPEWKNVIERKF